MGFKKICVTLGVTTIMLTNGIALAAVNPNIHNTNHMRPPVAASKYQYNISYQDKTELARFLKLSMRDFERNLYSGKSLATIAKNQRITKISLSKFVTKQDERRVNNGVRSGALSRQQAQFLRKNTKQRVEQLITAPGMNYRNNYFNHRPGARW